MARDRIVRTGGSVIQHGTLNDRVYLLKMGPEPAGKVIRRLESLASRGGYSKILAKVPARARDAFLDHGYEEEAAVAGLFGRLEDGHFLSRFAKPWRARGSRTPTVEKVLDAALKRRGAGPRALPTFRVRRLGPDQAVEMAALYSEVFTSYPFPIHDPEYLRQTMAAQTRYYGVLEGRKLAALSSSEMDPAASNVELTDFATRPEHRGRGLAGGLIRHMEQRMAGQGLATAYTIARAESYGMNIAFAARGYRFGGTLVNNTNIGGRLESMNVWHRTLQEGTGVDHARGRRAAEIRASS
jgi:beta-lysine N6-acetyltransferase